MAHNEHHENDLKLPVLVTGPIDLGRLIRELKDLEDALLQLGLREGGSKVKLPKTSRLMDQVTELNKLNLLQETDRTKLKHYLETIKSRAPVFHMSFSADPSATFIEKMVTWFRKEIDPNALITIGLQPNLGAGCILRTTNRYFDLSLREDFAKKKDLLLKSLIDKQKVAA